MIKDLQTFLAADATLQALQSTDSTNPKVFLQHEITGRETSPLTRLSYVNDGTRDDVIDEAVVQISVFSQDYDEARAIVNYITTILDVWDQISIPSAYFAFKYSKKVGGGDRWEEDTRTHHMVRLYHVKFKRLTGG